MKLELTRDAIVDSSIPGSLRVDGNFECYTLERATVMIPPGEYTVEMTYSPHFQRPMPLVDGVRGRSAIRIHPGNTGADSDGCILVGNLRIGTQLGESRLASDTLNSKILAAIKAGEAVMLSVQD